MTPDEIVSALEKKYERIKAEHFRKIRQSARFKYDIYKGDDIAPYDYKQDEHVIDECVDGYISLSGTDKELVRLSLSSEVCSLVISAGSIFAEKCLKKAEQYVFTKGLYCMGMGCRMWDYRDYRGEVENFYIASKKGNLSFNDYFNSGEPFVDDFKIALEKLGFQYSMYYL